MLLCFRAPKDVQLPGASIDIPTADIPLPSVGVSGDLPGGDLTTDVGADAG